MKHGANASPASLPEYQETVEEIRALVRQDAPWLTSTDEPMLHVFIGEYVVHRRCAAALTQMSPSGLLKKSRAQQTQTKRARVLNELARDLGLSTAGRFRLGLLSAKTQAISVKPVRSEARAREVAEILQQARALPPTEPETAAEPTEEHTGEVVALHPVNAEVTDASTK